MQNKEKINIVYPIDNYYVPYCGISIISLLENNKGEDITIYIVGYNLSDQSKESLYNIGNKYNVTIKIIDTDNKFIEQCPIPKSESYLTIAIFIRLFLSSIFPDINKILYFDSDLIVKQNIRELWNIDISKHSLAGIIDTVAEVERFKGYVNAGVLLINLDYWRRYNIQQKFIDYLNNRGLIEHYDQDIINYVLKDTILQIALKYNTQFTFYLRNYKNSFHQSEIDDAINDPTIVHFNGSVKPWNKDSLHPETKTFHHYMKMSEWKNTPFKWSIYNDKGRRRFRFYKRNILVNLGLKKSIYKDIK